MTAIDQPSQYRPKERPVQAEETIGAKVAPSTILPPPAETPPVPAAAPAAPAEPAPAPAPAGGE
jgi:hypothetical protein